MRVNQGEFPDVFLAFRHLQSPRYVKEEQFKGLMDKVEQLHMKLEHLQPVAQGIGGAGAKERSAPYGDRTRE